MLCTDAILAENDIQGCSLCIQYRLPQQSLGQFLLRSWKMGGKRDPRYQCKSFLLHFEEDLPALKALRRDYHVPILSEPHPSAEENENALLSKASQVCFPLFRLDVPSLLTVRPVESKASASFDWNALSSICQTIDR